MSSRRSAAVSAGHRALVAGIALVACLASAATVALTASSANARSTAEPARAASATSPASVGSAKRPASPAAARATVTRLAANGQRVTIRGRVALPHDSARQRRRARVALTLTDAKGSVERFGAPVDARRGFRITRVTRLSGRLRLAVRVTLGGKPSGRTLTRVVRVAPRARAKPPQRGGSTGTSAPPPSGGPGPTTPAPQGTPLVGLFGIDAGVSHVNGSYSGSYFRMINPVGSYLTNNDSTARDSTYTLLAPGTDGGLRTDAYQPPSSPAFASDPAVEAVNGTPNFLISLSTRVVRPSGFFFATFGIVSAPSDPQFDVPDPLPRIVDAGGVLSGQLTSWAVGWNGNWFNQGTPKPTGAPPLAERGLSTDTTTPLTGSYDAASGRYVVRWRSLIVSGPFNGFTGEWRLEGTFTPAGG